MGYDGEAGGGKGCIPATHAAAEGEILDGPLLLHQHRHRIEHVEIQQRYRRRRLAEKREPDGLPAPPQATLDWLGAWHQEREA